MRANAHTPDRSEIDRRRRGWNWHYLTECTLCRLQAKRDELAKRRSENQRTLETLGVGMQPMVDQYEALQGSIGALFAQAKEAHGAGIKILVGAFVWCPPDGLARIADLVATTRTVADCDAHGWLWWWWLGLR